MFRPALVILSVLALSACSTLMNTRTGKFAEQLAQAMLNQRDEQIVREGMPAYLILIDAMINTRPANVSMLLAGARLYGSYATLSMADEERSRRLARQAMDYARSALCLHSETLCGAVDRPMLELEPVLDGLEAADVPVLYGYAVARVGWIRTMREDWDALAELPKVEAELRRVAELDEGWDGGSAHMYLGILNSQRPAALGGKPEIGRLHFERSIELSAGRNLMAKVLFARYYARMMFDRELHDRLLREVIEADLESPGFTMTNVIAKKQAVELLAGGDAYF